MLSLLKDAETGQRGFVITGDESFKEPYTAAIPEIPKVLKELHDLTSDNPHQQDRLKDVASLVKTKLDELELTIRLRTTEGVEATTKVVQGKEGKIAMDKLRDLFKDMEDEEHGLLKDRAKEVEDASITARWTIVGGSALALVLVTLVGFLIVSSLTKQIGTAVQNVQSSSSELQSVATQQVTGTREQATAMNEIATTISELLATSRQIAESARRVAQIAAETAGSSKAGAKTMESSQDAIGSIRRQVDTIVVHMLDLGKKSQQIGGILEIINELAEQTNILAINATIEAAGAGDSGKRFAVVADEIRKLADRVGGSTKEIRTLIEQIRSAVNTTVMATETGSKSVDAGARQFAEVEQSFKQIAALVATTTEAAREIELSTKQQSSAVEQVNTAIANVAQATREAEASSNQTLQTASQLTHLSSDLTKLIKPVAV